MAADGGSSALRWPVASMVLRKFSAAVSAEHHARHRLDPAVTAAWHLPSNRQHLQPTVPRALTATRHGVAMILYLES